MAVHPRAWLRQVLRTRHQSGWRAALWVAAEPSLRLVLGLDAITLMHLPRTGLQGAASAVVSTRLARAQDLQALEAQGDWGMDAAKWRCFEQGDWALLSEHQGELAGYTWIHERGCPEILPGLWLRLPPGWLYNFAAFTHPRFRGGGLQAARHGAVFQQVRWQDSVALLGWVHWSNHASQRGQARSGYQPLGHLLRWGWGRWRWHWLSPALRGLGLSPSAHPPQDLLGSRLSQGPTGPRSRLSGASP